MMDPAALPPPLARIPTGVPGLDEVTGGGFLQSGVYILQGAPGAGKTILANQIVHRHAAAGGQVVYVTLLAESHARLLQHMESFSFFQPEVLTHRVTYVSAFHALRSGGLEGVIDLLRSEMRTRHAGILVLDGLVMAETAADSHEALKLFIGDVQTHSTLTGCTTLLLTSEDPDRGVSAEQTMVDGILVLRERAYGPRRERNIEAVKFRGSSTLRGNHSFRIGAPGITIHPRLEALPIEAPGPVPGVPGVSTGVAQLDACFDIGGYARGTVTVLSGPSGCGKTTLALHYLAQASAQEPGLFLGFYESPAMLERIAALLGIAEGGLAGPYVHLLWQPFGEHLLDALAARLLAEVRRTGATRVVIDGIGGFMAAPSFPERGGPFVAALMNELRRLGATTVITVEELDAAGSHTLDTPTLSAVCDTMLDLTLRYDERIRRFFAIRKSRVSRCDLRVHELVLTASGLALADPGTAQAG